MSLIQVKDKMFRPFIKKEALQQKVSLLGSHITKDYAGLNPLLLGILNGSFVFAADLFRHIETEAEISFIKLASYKGTASTGSIKTAIGLNENIEGRHIIIVEDIVDTGNTLHAFLPTLFESNPASVKIAALLTKPAALLHDIKVDYPGFEISREFVIGYGLDYEGHGRNLPELYQVTG